MTDQLIPAVDDLPVPWPRDRDIVDSGWRSPTDQTVVSADDHVMEPLGLWEDRMPADYDGPVPRLWHDEDGYHVEVEGEIADLAHFPSNLVEGRRGIAELDLRLADMDAEGTDMSVCFPQRALTMLAFGDPARIRVAFDVYNEWLAEWCAQSDRLIGVPVLPTFLEPEATGAYIDKLKALGFHTMMIPQNPRGVAYNSSAMEPMWEAIAGSGLPVCVHISEAFKIGGAGAALTYVTTQLQSFRPLWSLLTFSGILDRHPDLHVVFAEGGASWASSAIHDADHVYKNWYSQANPKLAELPSFYWHRQCSAAFMNDPLALREADVIGAENLMYSVDYPHPEGIVGSARTILAAIYDQLPVEQADLVVGGNAIRVFGLQEKAARIRAAKLAAST